MPDMPTESEQSLAKRLAHTEKSVRDEAFTMVGNWLESQLISDVEMLSTKGDDDGEADKDLKNELHLEMLKFWKALFYCVWMSDKPAVQMELVGKVAQLVRIFRKLEVERQGGAAVKGHKSTLQKHPSGQSEALLWNKRAECGLVFLRCFFETLTREWAGLDRYRLDKFLSLIRRMLHEAFLFCSDHTASKSSSEMTDWEAKSSAGVATVLKEVMSAALTPNGIRLHIADIYIDELFSALSEKLNTQLVLALLVPMSNVLRSSDSLVLFERVATAVWSGSAPGGVKVGSGSGLLWRLINPDNASSSSSSSSTTTTTIGQAIFRINTATVARFLFSIGADPSTRSSQRSGVYALHKEWAVEALKLGHAKKESETYPEGGMVVMKKESAAITDGSGIAAQKKRGRDSLLETSSKNKVNYEGEEEEEEGEGEEDGEGHDDKEEGEGEVEVKKSKKKRVRQKDRAIKVEEKEHKVGKPRGLKSAAKSKKKFNRRLRK